jgi:hypothetical protein
MRCRLSWVDPASRPGGAAGPTLTPCAGPRFRPLAVGYVRLRASDPLGHVDALAAQLLAFAHVRGLTLADVYTEPADVLASREGAAFRALVEALRRPHICAVSSPPLNTSRGSAACTRPCVRSSTWKPAWTC